MLYFSTRLSNIPLLSIRSGGRIGTIIGPIINPNNLHIDGFYCTAAHNNMVQIILYMQIREFSNRGIIINDHNDLSDIDELVRLKTIIDLDYSIIDKQVLINKKRSGKVSDYAIDKESLFIQKFYVKPPLLISFKQANLIFDRKSVVEVTDSYIAFSGPEDKAPSRQLINKPNLTTDYSTSASLTSE
jgi:hypothetical protein